MAAPIPTLLSCLLACSALAAGPASAATTRIGAVEEMRAGTNPDPITAAQGDNTWAVQVGEATGTYAVPAGYGVITAWSHSTGNVAGAVTFKVYRPQGSNRFLVLAANTRTVQADTVHEFPVRIRVLPGDRIGISTTRVEVAYNSGAPADLMGMFPFRAGDPAPGTTATQDGPPFVGYRVDVAARVETDADGDGFGDDSQDGCPTSAATQGACPGTALPAFSGCPARAANVIRGTGAANTMTGTPASDRIFAGAGDDRVDGSAGDDCVDLGTGGDRGRGGPGADLLLGGPGGDRLSGNSRGDRVRGGSGRDLVSGGSSGDRLSGEGGGDRLNGNSGNDRIRGGSGTDRITGGSGGDRISGGSGNDRIGVRDRRRDRVSCGRGRDTVVADRADRVGRDCERVRR